MQVGTIEAIRGFGAWGVAMGPPTSGDGLSFCVYLLEITIIRPSGC